MEWLKRAPGVRIFLLVWLLVALVPFWRLRAARQWQNTQINDSGLENSLGFAAHSGPPLARLFPDDVVAQLGGSQLDLFRVSEMTYSSNQSLGFKQQPQHLQQQVEDNFNGYAALLRRFPASNLVRAQWLRDATRGTLRVESDDLLATDKTNRFVAAAKNGNWLSDAQIARAIGVAQEGARLEPDNAFWPSMEAVFQFSLRRDEAALQTLERAGKCARFDDGVLETTRRSIALMHRVQTADFNDDLWEMSRVLLPHLGRLRAAARAAMWQAKLALGRGDTARALQIAGIVQRAGAPMARSRGILVTRLIGEAQCYIAWHQLFEKTVPTPQPNPDSGNLRREIVEKFAAYARRNGRDDLARNALALQASFNSRALIDAQNKPDSVDLVMGIAPLARYHWASAWLLRLAGSGAGIWLFCALLKRGAVPQTTRRASLIAAAFCSGATGALLWAAIRGGAVTEFSSLSGAESPAPVFDADNLWWLLLLLWGAPVLTMSVVAATRSTSRPQKRVLGRVFVGAALLYAGLVASFYIVVNTISLPLKNTVAGQFWPAPALIFAAFLLATCVFQIRRARPEWKPSAYLVAGAALLWAPVFLISQSQFKGLLGQDYGWAYITALILLLSAVVWWMLKSGSKLVLQGALVSELMARARLAAATLALASTLAYFALIFAAMPSRYRAQKVLDRQLQIGEIAWMEEQLKLKDQ